MLLSQIGVVLDRTTFYAESGGQIYDTGALKVYDGAPVASEGDADTRSVVANVAVSNVQSFAGYVCLHRCHVARVVSGCSLFACSILLAHVSFVSFDIVLRAFSDSIVVLQQHCTGPCTGI